MLSFIYGAAGTGKTAEIYNRAAEAAKTGENSFILVPEQYSMYAEQELIDRFGISVQSRVQIITFSRLSNMIFSKYGPLRMRYVDKAGKYMIARCALQRSEKELSELKANSRQRGFAKLIATAVSEFKRYGVTPDILNETSDKCDNERLAAKLRDLSVVYRRFNEITEEGFSNSEDNLSLILPLIEKCDFLSGNIFINFFHSFTPTEYAIISELMKKADLCFVLCTDTLTDESSVFSAQVHTYKKLSALANEVGAEVSVPKLQTEEVRHRDSEELLFLKSNLYAARANSMKDEPKSIRLLRPSGYYDEVVDCAKLILRLTREKGYSFNDFLILTGGMENYERILPAIFDEFNIKYFIDRKALLTENPLMRMIVSAVEILAYGFSYERVMTIVRSGFTDISKSDADVLENYILAADITHGQWEKEEWSYNPGRGMFDMERVNRAKNTVIKPLCELTASFSGRKTVQTICRNFYAWLVDMKTEERVKTKIDDFASGGMYENAENLRLVWNSFVSVLGCMIECLGDEYITFADYYEIFLAACSELSVGMVPPTKDKVVISDTELFRSTGTKVVIILGANEGVFPKAPSPDGLINDRERGELEALGLTLAPDSFTKQKEARYSVYSALTTASELLYISVPLCNGSGETLGVSSVVNRIRERIFPKLKFEDKISEDAVSGIEGREHTFYMLMAKLFESRRNAVPLQGVWKNIYEYFTELPDYRARISHYESISAENLYTEISKSTAKLLYGEPLVLSVSKLEKYNACAFSFFMRYGLLADERLIGGFQAKDMGNVLHSALQKYFEDKTAADYDFDSINYEDCYRDISDIIEVVSKNSNEVLYEASAYYKYTIFRMKSIAAQTAWKMTRFYSRSAFRPRGFEVKFGRGGALPPFKLDGGAEEVYLEGFVDRIDSADIGGENLISITDYKSSDKKLDQKMIDAGLNLQPLIYMSAVCRNTPSAQPAGMFYMHMNDPIVKEEETLKKGVDAAVNNGIAVNGFMLGEHEVLSAFDDCYDDESLLHYVPMDEKYHLSREVLKMKTEQAQSTASETAGNIVCGRIEAEPTVMTGFNPCEYCAYKAVCAGI